MSFIASRKDFDLTLTTFGLSPRHRCSNTFSFIVHWLAFLLYLAGDIHSNPGPVRRPRLSRKAKPLNICFSNVRGFRSKFIAIEVFLQQQAPDILAVSESRLDSEISSLSFAVPGFNLHRLDMPPSHGLAVYVKDSLPISRETVLESHNHEFMCFKLSLLQHTFFLFFLYRSPSSSSCEVLDSISCSIDQALQSNPSANIMICGNFNVHHKQWLIHSRTTDVPGTLSYDFALSLMTLSKLSQDQLVFLISQMIRHICLTSFFDPDQWSAEVLAPLGTSDHAVVSVKVSCSVCAQALPLFIGQYFFLLKPTGMVFVLF